MAGGGCDATVPPQFKCPNPMWRAADVHSGGVGCCESNSDRGPTAPKCNLTCAEAECAAAHMFWIPENYSAHPYTCCNHSNVAAPPPPATSPIARPTV